mmetsp:Transcript_3582/g.8441  ORF Transcript_3582/g.8441 Transcript_3582/m.8441 type:complete len:386 (-) Transcript_3582:67-1224(-)
MLQQGGHTSSGTQQPVTEFDQKLLGRWLRILLVSFYNDEETVIADLLCQRACMLRDTTIAQLLGLPERQVRQALEVRLVPDCLVDRRTEGEGKRLQTYYRISHLAVAMTAQRLQLLEDGLATTGSAADFICPKCKKSYDSLRAMSLASSRRGVFTCEECNEELETASECEKLKRERRERFLAQCQELLLLTRRMKDMPIPHFSYEQKQKEPKASAKDGGAAPSSSPVASRSENASAALEDAKPGAPKAPAPVQPDVNAQTSWLCNEIFGPGVFDQLDVPASAPGRADEPLEAVAEELKQRFQKGIREDCEQLLHKPHRWSAAPSGNSLGRNPEDLTVIVQGKSYPLTDVRDNTDLQDSMADDEYQRFFDLERELQRSAMLGAKAA